MSCRWRVVQGAEDFAAGLTIVGEEGFVHYEGIGGRRGGKKMIGEQDAREIRIHPLVKVLSPRQEVGDRIRGPGDMFQRIIEILQEFDPSGLSAGDLLWLAEVLEIFVVGEDAHRMLRAEEQGATTFEAEHYTRKFAIVDVVVSFGR